MHLVELIEGNSIWVRIHGLWVVIFHNAANIVVDVLVYLWFSPGIFFIESKQFRRPGHWVCQ